MTIKIDKKVDTQHRINNGHLKLNPGCRRVTVVKTRIGYADDPRAKRMYNNFMNLPGGGLR